MATQLNLDARRVLQNRLKENGYVEKTTTTQPVVSTVANEENDLYKRYNINPDNFGLSEFYKWLDDNNMQVYDYKTGSYGPKVEGGFLGIGGKTLATEQQIKDADALYESITNKMRNPDPAGSLKYLGKQVVQHLDNSTDSVPNTIDALFATAANNEAKMYERMRDVIVSNGATSPKWLDEQIESSKEFAKKETEYAVAMANERNKENAAELEKIEQEHSNLPETFKAPARFIGQAAEMAPQVALTAVAPIYGTAYLGGTVYGNSYVDAINDGASADEASITALTSAALEMAIEKLGGNKMFGGKTLTDNIMDKVTNRLVKNKTAQKFVRFLLETNAEGTEEVLSAVLQPFIKQLAYKGKYDAPTIDELAENYLGGAVGSAVWSGMGKAVNFGSTSSLGKDIKNSKDANVVIDRAIEYGINSADDKTKKLATKVYSQRENGLEGISNRDLGALVRDAFENKYNVFTGENIVEETPEPKLTFGEKVKATVGFVGDMFKDGKEQTINAPRVPSTEGSSLNAPTVAEMQKKAPVSTEGSVNAPVKSTDVQSAIERITNGTATNKDYDLFKPVNAKNRQMFEDVTGVKLPATNSETRKYLRGYTENSEKNTADLPFNEQQNILENGLPFSERNGIINYRADNTDYILNRDPISESEAEVLRQTVYAENPEIPDVIKQIDDYAKNNNTSLINTPERTEYRLAKAKEYYETFEAKSKYRKAVIIIGPPAAGKSTIANQFQQELGAIILDSDIIKEGDADADFKGIPEYNNGIGVQAVHNESSDIADDILDNYILSNGDNLVYPKLGSKVESITKIIDKLKGNGYKITLVLNDLPVEKALDRSVSRYKSTGRLVSPEIILECGYNPVETYNKIKEMGLCDGYEVYSNDVEFGQQPILIEKTNINEGRIGRTERNWQKSDTSLGVSRRPGFTNYETDEGSKGTISERTSGEILSADGGVQSERRNDGNGSGRAWGEVESAGKQSTSVSSWRQLGNRRINELIRISDEARPQNKEAVGRAGEKVTWNSVTNNGPKSDAEIFIENEAQKYGLEVEYATGLTVTSKDGKVTHPVAFARGNNIVLSDRATFKDALHEIVHHIRKTNPRKYNAIKAYIAENMDTNIYNAILETYIYKYSQIYGFGDLDQMSERDRARAMDIIEEEMVCDISAHNKIGNGVPLANQAEFTHLVDELFDTEKETISYTPSNSQTNVKSSKSPVADFMKKLDFMPLPKTKNGNVKRNITQTAATELLDIFNEYAQTGEINRDKAQALFDMLYNSSVVESVENFDEAADYIKSAKIYVSPENKGAIPDFNKFRQSMFKKLDITTDNEKGGISIDEFFEGFISSFPGMVDETLTRPADRLQALADFVTDAKTKQTQALDDYFGEGAESAKEQMQEMFNEELDAFVKGNEIRYSAGEQGTDIQGSLSDEVLSLLKVNKVKMKNFPSYKTSKSDAHENATRWAYQDDVESGAQTIAFYHDKCYLIEKFAGLDFGYQICGTIRYSDYQRIIKGVKKNDTNKNGQPTVRTTIDISKRNKQGNSTKRGEYGTYGDATEYRRESGTVYGMVGNKNGERQTANNGKRNNESDGKDREIDSTIDIRYSTGTTEKTADHSREELSEREEIRYSAGNDNSEQFGVMWTIAEGVATSQDVAEFYHLIGECEKGTYKPIQTDEGDLFETTNKLFYADSNYLKPTVNKIIGFNTKNYGVLNLLKDVYIENARTGIDSKANCEIIEAMQGEGIVSSRDFRDSATFTTRQNSGRNRTDSGKYNSSDDIKYSIDTLEKTTDYYTQRYAELLEEYGAIKKGAQPRVEESKTPKQSSPNKYVSHYARTMSESGLMPDEMQDDFTKMIVDGTMSHEVFTDKMAEKGAEARIAYNGYDDSVNEFHEHVKSGRVNKEDIALGQMLFNLACQNKNVELAKQLAVDLSLAATQFGQNVQAFSMLKRMSPDGQLYYLEKSVEKINRELLDKFKGDFKEIKIDPKLEEDLINSQTQEETDNAVHAIEKNIGEQIPADFADKWNAWRYLSMLGNTRTHFRNILGNAAFVPARKVKNLIGAGIEKALPKAQRTKSVTKTADSKDFAAKDWEFMADIVKGYEGKYDTKRNVESHRTIFKTKWLEVLRKFNLSSLEAEDAWFLKGAYKDAFAQAMSARGLTSEFLNSGTKEANEQLESLRNYAINEAQRATYRDLNAFSEFVSKLGYKGDGAVGKAFDKLLEGALPFKATPANILVRGVEYSPIGLAKGLVDLSGNVKNGKMSASKAIDEISSGLVGTAIVAFGYLMCKMGVLVVEPDEDDEVSGYKKMLGSQNYALKFGDNTYTIDWMAPAALPLFVGAELFNTVDNTEKVSFTALCDSLTRISEPAFELSCLSGIQNALESIRYAEKDEIVFELLGSLATSYIQQALPTIGSQLARSIDNTKRNAYYKDKNSNMPEFLNTFIQQAAAKIPGATYLLPEKVDRWGRTEKYGGLPERVLENFVSPGYYSNDKSTITDKKLMELYKKTGDASVLPDVADKSFMVDGEREYLSTEEYVEYSKTRGSLAYEYITKFMTELGTNTLDNATKVNVIKGIYGYANAKAKSEVSNYVMDSQYQKVEKAKRQGISPEQYFVAYYCSKDIAGDKNSKGTTIKYTTARNQMRAIKKNVKGLSEKRLYKLLEIMGYSENEIKFYKYNLPRKN